MQLGLYEILKNASEQKTKAEKIRFLRENNSPALQLLLQYCFDKNIVWLLPEGVPPYRPNDLNDVENVLFFNVKKLYLFVEGGNPYLTQPKREQLFINLLEQVGNDDAKLLCSIKDRKLPFSNLSYKLIQETFPENFSQSEEQ